MVFQYQKQDIFFVDYKLYYLYPPMMFFGVEQLEISTSQSKN